MIDLALSLLHSFFILFIIFDPLGNVPIFYALTEGRGVNGRRSIAKASALTAGGILIFFAVLGDYIFKLLRITINDFRVAAGVVLFILSVEMVLGRLEKLTKKVEAEDVAVVPLATPLLAGPGSISTTMYIMSLYGPLHTLLTVGVNVALAYIILAESEKFFKLLGRNGSRAITRIMGLLTAAIAVSIMREGIQGLTWLSQSS